MRAGEEKGIAALFAGLDVVTVDATTGALAGERLRRYRGSHRLELGDASSARLLSNTANGWRPSIAAITQG